MNMWNILQHGFGKYVESSRLHRRVNSVHCQHGEDQTLMHFDSMAPFSCADDFRANLLRLPNGLALLMASVNSVLMNCPFGFPKSSLINPSKSELMRLAIKSKCQMLQLPSPSNVRVLLPEHVARSYSSAWRLEAAKCSKNKTEVQF